MDFELVSIHLLSVLWCAVARGQIAIGLSFGFHNSQTWLWFWANLVGWMFQFWTDWVFFLMCIGDLMGNDRRRVAIIEIYYSCNLWFLPLFNVPSLEIWCSSHCLTWRVWNTCILRRRMEVQSGFQFAIAHQFGSQFDRPVCTVGALNLEGLAKSIRANPIRRVIRIWPEIWSWPAFWIWLVIFCWEFGLLIDWRSSCL